ncbi:MAG: sulfotransferase [Gammaproteobacteria bacterium]
MTNETLPPLDTEALLDHAMHVTGLSEFGEPGFAGRLGLMVERIRARGLNAEGQRAAAGVLAGLLADRLRLFDDHLRLNLANERIDRPVIATGEPRSGTTLLHALLGEDPQARVARFWAIMHPSPPAGLAAADDPRIAQADEEWREILRLIPKWMISHPYNDMLGNGLPECERFWALDLRMPTPTAWWRVPMAPFYDLPQDHARQYAIHKMMLQAMQHGAPPGRHWALKGTSHHLRLAALFQAYPDARVIWTHRDPVQIIASRIQLIGEIIEGIAGSVDWAALAAETLAMTRGALAAILADPLVDDPRIHHVRYQDFTRDQAGTIGKAYAYFGMPFTPEYEGRIGAWLAGNRPDRYGKFRYSADLIGVDVEALHREFAPYRARFGIDIDTPKHA